MAEAKTITILGLQLCRHQQSGRGSQLLVLRPQRQLVLCVATEPRRPSRLRAKGNRITKPTAMTCSVGPVWSSGEDGDDTHGVPEGRETETFEIDVSHHRTGLGQELVFRLLKLRLRVNHTDATTTTADPIRRRNTIEKRDHLGS